MSDYNPSDPAIYGPVNGVFVTLSQFKAWQQQTFAADQASAKTAYDQAAQVFTAQTGAAAPPNPYVASTPASSPPPGATGALSPHYVAGPGISDYCILYPDDPLCDFWGGIGVGGGGGGGGVVTVNNVTVIEGISGTDVNAAIDNGLSAVWSAVVGSVDAVVAAIVATVQGALTGIGNAVKAAYAILSRLGGFILGVLQQLLRDLVKAMLKALQDIRDLFKHLIDDVLKPILGVLGSLRQRLLDLYTRFLRPMLLVLQNIHRLLTILAVFHVGFARRLDAKLQALEGKFLQPFLTLLAYTNQLGNWINLIITANYLIQKPIWLASLKGYAGSTINAQINAMNPAPDPAAAAALSKKYQAQPAAKTYGDFDTWTATGGGDSAATIADYGSQFDTLLQQSF